MKTLIVLTSMILSANSFACNNRLPESEVVKAIALAPNAGSVTCEDLPKEKCLCFDHIDDWETAELIDDYRNGDPIYTSKTNVLDCETGEACEELRKEHCKNDELFFYAENLILSGYEAYCTKLEGYEQVLSGKKLVNSPDKKAAHEAQKQAKEDAKKAKEDLKLIKKSEIKEEIKNATTVAKLRAVVEKLIEEQEGDL